MFGTALLESGVWKRRRLALCWRDASKVWRRGGVALNWNRRSSTKEMIDGIRSGKMLLRKIHVFSREVGGVVNEVRSVSKVSRIHLFPRSINSSQLEKMIRLATLVIMFRGLQSRTTGSSW